MAKIGRNDPCYCGSGLKYKKCCLIEGHTNQAPANPEGRAKMLHNINKRFGKELTFAKPGQAAFKMSEVILEFADEILDRARTVGEREKSVAIACFAWNLALHEEDERKILQESFCKDFSGDDLQAKENLNAVISYLVQRKLDHYFHINRVIVEYHVSGSGERLQLDIASTVQVKECV